MSVFIYQHTDWPQFRWKQESLASLLAEVRHRQGRLIGRMESLGFLLREEAVLQTLTQDVLKSSEVEGEVLNREQVRSSLARRLGMNIGVSAPVDRNVEGVVEMMLDATQQFGAPLTEERLFGWHASLFPTGRSGMKTIKIAAWRDANSGPMQVVSGPIGREWVHFEAPKASRLAQEMAAFLYWFNSETVIDPVLKAGLAHLWFVTLHPFDDGNGRIARAIADLSLARSEQTAQRFYSMSAQILQERNTYYQVLEQTQKGTLDVTLWMVWFLNCLDRAFGGAEITLGSVLTKAGFWEAYAETRFNDRQRLMINKILDGFAGKLTSSKWAKIAKCSQDTALRDISELITLGVLTKDAASGRSTNYFLADV